MELIAHRGGRGFGTDNTLQAMEEAVRNGVRRIETDIRCTEDGRLIVCHDAIIWGRVISRTTYADLKKHDPERPLLSEVLERLAGWVRFNLEIKDAPVPAVGEMIAAYSIESDTLVTSFKRSFLEEFNKSFPEVSTGFLFRMPYGQERKLVTAVSMRARMVLPHFHSIDEGMVRRAHDLGLEVYAWTVNEPDDMRRLMRWGVDGIITDRYLEMMELTGGRSGGTLSRGNENCP